MKTFVAASFAIAALLASVGAMAADSTPAPAKAAPVAKAVKCAKNEDRVAVMAIIKVPAPGYVGVEYKGKNANGTMLLEDAELKSKGLVVGSQFCMKQES